MIIFLRYLFIVVTLSVLLTFYLVLLITIPVREIIQEDFTQKSVIKEIVAYSLRKQIEIESEKILCDTQNSNKVIFENFKGLWTRILNSQFYVFNVYYDNRLEPFRYVRIIGMIKGFWNESLYCRVDSEFENVHITKAVRTDIWLKEWNIGDENTFNPVLISCNIPNNSTPKTVSITTTNPCNSSGVTLKIIYPNKSHLEKKPKSYSTTICVKPLIFTKDISSRLIDWIEMNKILGANKFEFFVENVPKSVRNVLNFYKWKHKGNFKIKRYVRIENFYKEQITTHQREEDYLINKTSKMQNVSLKKYNYSVQVKEKMRNDNHVIVKAIDVGNGNEVNVSNKKDFNVKLWQKRKNELIAYNDCLYRNLYSSHFIIPVDIDEIIVPRQFYTWKSLLQTLFTSSPNLQDQFASFSVRNAYFLQQFTPKRKVEKNFFKYNKRSEFSGEGESGKSFVLTKNTLTVFNHYSLDALKPGIRKTYFMPREIVQMNHYKKTCSINLLPQCAKYLFSPIRIVDNIINKYKKEFEENYTKIISEFNVFNKKRKFNNVHK